MPDQTAAPDTATAPDTVTGPDFATVPYDLLITGGTVIDGTGAAPRRADVAVRGDRVVRVGDPEPDARAVTTLDATGLAVTPGFVDLHSHADFSVLAMPDAEACLRQG
ncbi:hypothetical protein ACFQ60_39895 [Streptomyces zhihengii]